MKLEVCSFSGYKVYPGHGKRMVRLDGRGFFYLNGKCESLHKRKRNPRKINWTVLYRRKHKKGQIEEAQKRRTKRTTKVIRAIAGASLADIMAKRNQEPEVRKAMREQALKAAKDKQKAKEEQKKTKKKAKAAAPTQPKLKPAKVVSKPNVRVGGKR